MTNGIGMHGHSERKKKVARRKKNAKAKRSTRPGVDGRTGLRFAGEFQGRSGR